ncbi:zinc ribbon domain-containing protein [Olsenella sp. oral taxon 807]|uniref:zinc ribbon domain-containing protein n=1 Tax=Olsenella sp. oral taxon 807 TaxID=712411 RepID=UPI0009FAE109|nr:zinc ribbon domain-containing protein [Olsenella sp. oral taxon 807]
MFCPSCGTRNPDGVRFCRACGTNLSGRRAGTTQRPVPAASATPTPAAQAPTPAVPTGRVIGQGRRRSNPFAAVAAMVVVGIFVLAVGLQVGSSTSWFGLTKPHLTPGTYTLSRSLSILFNSWLPPATMTVSVAEGDRVSFTVEGASWVGDAQVSQAGKDQLHIQVPIAAKNGQPSGHSFNFVVPQGAPDSVTGIWASWTTDENGLPDNGVAWAMIEDGGTFRAQSVPNPDAAAVAESLKAGNFRGDPDRKPGKWVKREDGSYKLTLNDYTYVFQYQK